MKDYAVIFDMDGVLVDSYKPHFDSWVMSCDKRGFTITDELIKELFGRSFKDFADRISPHPLTDEEIDKWHLEKESAYRDIINRNFPEIDGAFDLMQRLYSSDFNIGIASSGSRDNVDCLLNHLPVPGYVSATISACDTLKTKPDPEPFLKCAEKLNTHPERCVIIEDSTYGLQAAKAGGMKAIGLTSTRTRKELELYADIVVDSLRKITPETIYGLFGI